MANYIDAFQFPIRESDLKTYQAVAEQVAEVWLSHGALAYQEFVGDDLHRSGLRSFDESLELNEGEVVVMGWAVFPSKDVRDQANQAVPKDPRMNELVAPLFQGEDPIFKARRMIYGGFKVLVSKD